MDWHTGFISWFSRHIYSMKIISEMDNKFFGLKKKITINFIDCLNVFTKVFVFIIYCICLALSCRLSAQFCPQLPPGCLPAAV